MKAMVLAAGLSERMRPLTEDRAKPSLPLLNRPIIVHTLEHLKRHGVEEVIINLHYQPESIRGIVGDGSRHGLKVHFSEEPIILGTAGGLKKAEEFLRDGPFVLANADSVSDCDLGAALRKHQESDSVATMVLTPCDPAAAYGIVEVGEGDRIQRIAGHPPGDTDPRAGRYHFTGLHILEPEIFDLIPQGRIDINRDVYPRLIASGKPPTAYVHAGFWRELGTPRLYLDGSMAILRERKDPTLQALRASDGIYLDKVSLPADVTAEPPVLAARGTTFGTTCALLGGVVIGRQARIGKGCSLRSTVVWDGARIGDGARLSECVVMSGVNVPPRVGLTGKIFLRPEGHHGGRNRFERLGGCWMTDL
jgi:NDP-sugar pyrophosphorylase family protein